jgi:hypothetical protein
MVSSGVRPLPRNWAAEAKPFESRTRSRITFIARA